MSNLLQIEKLNYSYPKHVIFSDFSFSANKAAVFYGPNGCGKTTLLRLAAHLLLPESGEIQLNHNSHYKASVLFDTAMLMDSQTVRAHIQWFCNWQAQVDAQTILELSGLQSKADICVANLSLGQKQMLALSLVSHIQADMLILDEPFAHLDEAAQNRATTLINDITMHTFVMIACVERTNYNIDAAFYKLGE